MFTSLLKRIQTNLANAKSATINSIEHFDPWDYLLAVATMVTPYALGLPWYSNILSITLVGVSLIIPRKEILNKKCYVESSPDIDHAWKIIREICDIALKMGKPLERPDYILSEKETDGNNLHAKTVITAKGERILILPTELAAINDAELTILLEHELAHLYFQDPIGATYTRRLYLANAILSCMGLPNQLLLTLGWSGMMFLVKQASNRYREYRADHYAFQNTADDRSLNSDKIANLKTFLMQKDEQNLTKILAKSVQENEPLLPTTLYLINSYLKPKTPCEQLTNELLNLVKTHPTPHRRFNI